MTDAVFERQRKYITRNEHEFPLRELMCDCQKSCTRPIRRTKNQDCCRQLSLLIVISSSHCRKEAATPLRTLRYAAPSKKIAGTGIEHSFAPQVSCLPPYLSCQQPCPVTLKVIPTDDDDSIVFNIQAM